jgi:hypothetical protein
VIDAPSGAQGGEDGAFLVQAIRREERRDRPSHDLVGPIAEELLRTFIPRANDPVQILADDRIVGRGDDCSEQGLERDRIAVAPDCVSRRRRPAGLEEDVRRTHFLALFGPRHGILSPLRRGAPRALRRVLTLAD